LYIFFQVFLLGQQISLHAKTLKLETAV
jgi:hypothetical protein